MAGLACATPQPQIAPCRNRFCAAAQPWVFHNRHSATYAVFRSVFDVTPKRNVGKMSVRVGRTDKKGQGIGPDLVFVVEMMGFEPTTPTLRT